MKNTSFPDGFQHPGYQVFDECERTFKTSYFANGGVLIYTDKGGNNKVISGKNDIHELQGVCSDCSKLQGCLVHETLLHVLNYVRQKEKIV